MSHIFHTRQRTMDWLFGHRKTPEELLKENQRLLKKSIRCVRVGVVVRVVCLMCVLRSELDRERTHLEQQEVKVIADIKKAAKAGQLV